MPSSSRRRSGFTLVELLVVIGIIAILIAILLPGLNAARRQSRSVKCLSALRSLGQAMLVYAQNNQGMYPYARHDQYSYNGIQTRWADRLVPYVTSSTRDASLQTAADYDMLRENSVLFGCPEWSDKEKNSGGQSYARTGYGMQLYPWAGTRATSDFSTWNINTYNPSSGGGINGKTARAAVWGKSGADRLLLADGSQDYINVPKATRPDETPGGTFDPAVQNWWPFSTASSATTDIWLDGARHAKPGVSKDQTYRGKYINALFCDGHADTISVREAYHAIMTPGRDTAKP
jgi:prepilin-type N-terminal cleavage/methylation domain-containing protein/prepilin-type processing-associated H-X9-DG protein